MAARSNARGLAARVKGRSSTAPASAFELDLDKGCGSSAAVDHVVLGTGSPEIGGRSVLDHGASRAIQVHDLERAPGYGHDNVVEFVAMVTSILVLLECPDCYAHTLIVGSGC